MLIVEDAPIIRAIMVRELEQAGHRVDTAENGHQGLHKFRHGHWDLVKLLGRCGLLAPKHAANRGAVFWIVDHLVG